MTGVIRHFPLRLAPTFRLLSLLAIGGMIHAHHQRVMKEGQDPIRVSEARAFLPAAHDLVIDGRPRGGFVVVDRSRTPIGHVARTMPQCRNIKGYSGPTDALMVSDANGKLVGIAIRHSYDTPSHVDDVTSDYLFMEGWNGLTWEQIAERQGLQRQGIQVVSGATRTSEAVAKSIAFRAQEALGAPPPGPDFAFRWHDAALVLFTSFALALAFVKKPWIQRRKAWIHLAMVLYLGLLSSDLLAQSLLVHWMEHGIPWRTAPGLVLLASVAFAIPWSTGHPVYCTHVCPHGHAQRWLMKLVPARRKLAIGPDEKWGFSALPGALLVVVLLVSFLKLPLDLAGMEPFDAWAIRGAGMATLLVAGASLLFAAFVPMGYCRYGCPTGLLLDLARRDRAGFCRRDLWLLLFLVLSAILYFGYDALKPWLLE